MTQSKDSDIGLDAKLDATEQLELIQRLREQNVKLKIDEHSQKKRQILLFSYSSFFTNQKVLQSLERLDNETSWVVVIHCIFDCPVIRGLPISRTVPLISTRHISTLKGTLINPDFQSLRRQTSTHSFRKSGK